MSPRRRRSAVVAFRRSAHRASVLAGDLRAIQTGRYAERVANRVLGRMVSRAMRSLWR